MTKKVFLVDYGGPEKITDIPAYLSRLFNDPHILSVPVFIRKVLAAWIVKKRLPKAVKIYKQLGGASPINATVRALCSQLNQKQKTYEFMPAFLFQKPFLSDELKRYPGAMIMPLFPHYSKATWGIINDQSRAFPKAICVPPYFDNASFIALICIDIEKKLKKYKHSTSVFILCTAHAIPIRHVKKGDPYLSHIEKQVDMIAKRFPAIPIKLGYQSRLGPVRWTTPSIEEVLASAQIEALDTALVVPLSFTIDNAETLIELDKHFATLSLNYGIKVWDRQACQNTNDNFQDFILRLLKDA